MPRALVAHRDTFKTHVKESDISKYHKLLILYSSCDFIQSCEYYGYTTNDSCEKLHVEKSKLIDVSPSQGIIQTPFPKRN